MVSNTNADAVTALNTLIETATTLLQQLQNALSDIQRSKAPGSTESSEAASDASSPDPLALARDSALLIRAHATKIGLLVINEPFTPSAVATVVRELVTGAIPALASSVEICHPSKHTALLRRELAGRAQRVFAELSALLQRVPKDGRVLSGDAKNSFGSGPDGKGALATTGKLWAACDDLTSLANNGVGGFFVKKAEEWRDTLKDVMEELKEWGDDEPDDEDDDDDDDDDAASDDDQGDADDGSMSKQEMLDDLMNSQTIPRSDPDKIRPRLESSLKRLRLVVLLYQALCKRRFKKLPALPPSQDNADLPKKLDETAKSLQELPDKFGELAGAFYELDPEQIDAAMADCFAEAEGASQLLSKNWDGSSDEFTQWTDKFRAEIKTP